MIYVPQKKCASTQDIKKRGQSPPICGTYIWRLPVKRCSKAEAPGAQEYRSKGWSTQKRMSLKATGLEGHERSREVTEGPWGHKSTCGCREMPKPMMINGDRDRDRDLCERQDQDGTPTSGRTMNTWQILWSSKNADRLRATVSVNRQSKAIAASGSS